MEVTELFLAEAVEEEGGDALLPLCVAVGVIRCDHDVTSRSNSQPRPSPHDSTPAAHRSRPGSARSGCLGAEKDELAQDVVREPDRVELCEEGLDDGQGETLVVRRGAI